MAEEKTFVVRTAHGKMQFELRVIDGLTPPELDKMMLMAAHLAVIEAEGAYLAVALQAMVANLVALKVRGNLHAGGSDVPV